MKTSSIAACLAALCVCAVALGEAHAQSGPEHVVVHPGAVSAPPWLGVQLEAKSDQPGVRVTNVLRRSPAQGSGIRVGDRIVAIDGQEVGSLREVQRVVRTQDAAAKIEVTVDRGGKRMALRFQLAPMPDPETVVERHLVGFEAPDFEFRYIGDGKLSRLSSLSGRPTVIDFWATWCGPCHKAQRELAEVKERYSERVNFLGVSSEAPAVVAAHLAKYPARYAMATDPRGAAHSAFAIASFPTLVVLDAEQRVAAVIFGANHRDALEKKLESLLTAP